MDGKPSMKAAWSGDVNPLNFVGHQPFSGTAEARIVKFCRELGYVKSQHSDNKSLSTGAWSWSCDPF